MKKLSLLFILCIGFLGAQAQCTPDPFAFLPLNPTPVDTLLGYVGVPFTQTITIKVPQDTTVTVPPVPPIFAGGTFTVNVIKQTLVGVDGMPVGFTYVCDNASCTWVGGVTGCWNISGTPTQAGVYNLGFNVATTVSDPAPGISIPATPVPFPYYLKVSAANAIEDQLNENAFRFAACKPSPASDITTLNFSYPTNTALVLTVSDLAGRAVRTENIRANAGINEYTLNVNTLQSGIYFLNLTDGKKMLQQKLIVQ